MILNKFEFLLMNNPIRALIQDKLEIKELRRRSSLKPNKKILEIGCGNGQGTKLIQRNFSPSRIKAIDLDKKMINLAKKKKLGKSIKFSVGDASKLRFKTNEFDAIFDFGIIHHIPNWKSCLNELKRVVKPGGQLVLEDLSIDTFQSGFGKVLRRLLDHPYEEMYTQKEFLSYLKKIGFKIEFYRQYYPLGILKYFVVIASLTK